MERRNGSKRTDSESGKKKKKAMESGKGSNYNIAYNQGYGRIDAL